ncbi:ParB/RepB/Spo0J family partition protein [Streptomyces longispororuber]|uniref:ParB/RepB/Spo0J family partition protein n=1 Tax=Streptomyces longispororuber TaxID=68230 RepID=UPI0036F7FDAC
MSKAKNLGAGSSFAQARPISARRAAIGAATVAPTDGVPEPTELSIKLISQNPDNPRESLRGLDGLAESIREIGLVNAITVATVDAYLSERPHRAEDLDEDARYVVVDGHRRLAASQLAGKETIRVSFNDALVSTDESLLEAAFVANFHRDDMNPLEQAHALQKLVEFYGSQNKASKRLGIGQSTISSKLSILDLDPVLQADLLEGRRTVEDVRNLSKLSPEEQRQRADARAESRRQKAAALSRRDNPLRHRLPFPPWPLPRRPRRSLPRRPRRSPPHGTRTYHGVITPQGGGRPRSRTPPHLPPRLPLRRPLLLLWLPQQRCLRRRCGGRPYRIRGLGGLNPPCLMATGRRSWTTRAASWTRLSAVPCSSATSRSPVVWRRLRRICDVIWRPRTGRTWRSSSGGSRISWGRRRRSSGTRARARVPGWAVLSVGRDPASGSSPGLFY